MNPDPQTPAHANKRLKGLVDAPSVAIVQYRSAAQTALVIPEIVALIGSFLPLFKQRVEEGGYYFVDTWLPKSLLRAGAVCKLWHSVLTPLLWQTYDLAVMAKKVPYSVLARNIGYVRNISLMDKKHKKHNALWGALANHKHIDRLEVHEAAFPVKKLIGPKTNTLTHLKLSGNCERMHPFLMIFLERQVHLRSLELTRFKFTASDWKRIIMNKPKLCKLTIGKQCDFKNFDDDEVIAEEVLAATEAVNDRRIQDSVATDVNRTMLRGSSVGSKRKSDDDSGDTGIAMKKRRKNRTILVNTPLPDAKNFGVLPITHLVLQDNRLMLPFQRAILEASPNLEQLEMCYTQKSSGREIAAVMRDNCRNIRCLTLTSTRQPWTLAMLENMPQSVEELILHTGQLDVEMTTAIIERAY
ncbi:hypothetical protein EC991_002675 [Linnemannia zychae]|nr:hypothetical protein EC991_002675 [Linnemannia zychae]